jgi:hypothetical protein
MIPNQQTAFRFYSNDEMTFTNILTNKETIIIHIFRGCLDVFGFGSNNQEILV